MKRVLLTGASGFVGQAIAGQLAEAGIHVRAVVRSKEKIIPEAHDFSVMPDLFSATSKNLATIMADVDTVIHCAWSVRSDDYLTSIENLGCLWGTLSIARVAAELGVERFVGVGTCFEYDVLSPMPLGAQSPLRPHTLYGAAKLSTLTILREIFRHTDVNFIWARFFHLYGPKEGSHRLGGYIRDKLQNGEPALISSGAALRDYMEITDAARDFVNYAGSSSNGIFNVCSGNCVSVKDIALKIASKYGDASLLNFAPQTNGIGVPHKIEGLPGLVERF